MSRPGGSAGLLTDRQVDVIATRLAERLSASSPIATASPIASNTPAITPRAEPGEGVFATVDDAVAAAGVAYRELDGMSLEGRQKIVASIRESMLEHAEELARHAQRETGLGRVEHKVIKNRLVTRKTSGTEVLTPHAVTGDNGLTLTEYAHYGVIGAITPTTNPTSTIICNTIAMLSAGNSIVFNVHPGARDCSMANVRLLHRAIIRGGGPANLVSAVAEPTIESAQELMSHDGVRLLAVTGGSGVVPFPEHADDLGFFQDVDQVLRLRVLVVRNLLPVASLGDDERVLAPGVVAGAPLEEGRLLGELTAHHAVFVEPRGEEHVTGRAEACGHYGLQHRVVPRLQTRQTILWRTTRCLSQRGHRTR